MFGGGQRICGASPYFGVDAISTASGATGIYALALTPPPFGGTPPTFAATVRVTCLAVDGNRAVIGGKMRPPDASPARQNVFVWLEDNGEPSGPEPGPDRVSLSFALPEDLAFLPPGTSFPDPEVSCPSPAGPPLGADEMFPIRGNVTVVDA